MKITKIAHEDNSSIGSWEGKLATLLREAGYPTLKAYFDEKQSLTPEMEYVVGQLIEEHERQISILQHFIR